MNPVWNAKNKAKTKARGNPAFINENGRPTMPPPMIVLTIVNVPPERVNSYAFLDINVSIYLPCSF